jgi:ribosomal protein S18 acetylase RimI-like enzyme
VQPTDPAAVRGIVASTGFFHDFEVDVAVELVQERLSRSLASEYHFLFADLNSHPIGYACFGPIPCTQGSFDLYWIAVHAAHQGSGLGRRLMAEAERAMLAGVPGADGRPLPPARRVYIETSSLPRYAPTWRFYERCEYTIEARLKDFYAAGDDKLIYAKALS